MLSTKPFPVISSILLSNASERSQRRKKNRIGDVRCPCGVLLFTLIVRDSLSIAWLVVARSLRKLCSDLTIGVGLFFCLDCELAFRATRDQMLQIYRGQGVLQPVAGLSVFGFRGPVLRGVLVWSLPSILI